MARSRARGMEQGGAPPPPNLRFSTDKIPEPGRIDLWKVFGEEVFRVRMEALSKDSFRANWKVRALGSIGIAWAENSPFDVTFPREFIACGNDNIVFSWASGPRYISHLGHELQLRGNDAALLSCSDPGVMAVPSGGRLVVMNIPRAPLRALLRDGEDCLGAPVPTNSDALNLLLRYAEMLGQDGVATSSRIQDMASAHICDLLALAIGPTRDAAGAATQRSLHAVRLEAIKLDAIRRIPDGDLSVSDVAARHRMSTRDVQRLFHDDGQTFTEFVRDRRLEYARRLLLASQLGHLRIADIAYEAGFNDLSYFNRMFRRRFGLTPSDLRATGMSSTGAPATP